MVKWNLKTYVEFIKSNDVESEYLGIYKIDNPFNIVKDVKP